MHEQSPNNEDKEHEENHEQSGQLQPQIWVGSLADYNNGDLHGEWIVASAEPDELSAAVHAMLARSPAAARGEVVEEYGIFDYDGFGTFKVGEYDLLDQVAVVAQGITEHGAAFAAWAELHDGDLGMLANFEDAYLGHYDQPCNWAEEMLEDIDRTLDAEVPESLRPYIQINYQAWVRDVDLDGSIYIKTDPSGGVWIFSTT